RFADEPRRGQEGSMMATGPARRRRERAPRRVLLVAGVLAALLAPPAASRADVDLGNDWVFAFAAFGTTVVCDLQLVQAGTTLSASGDCRGVFRSDVDLSGTVDPQSGAFSLAGTIFEPVGPTIVTVSLAGAPVAEGRLAGSATFDGESGSFVATLCGNANLDPGEACDDGAATDGCCTSACAPKPDGIACSTTADCQIAPTCSAGACVGTPRPAGTECEADGNRCTDDACDAQGSCVAGPCSPCCGGPGCVSAPRWLSCRRPTAERDLIDLQATPPGARNRDRAVWRIPRLQATTPADLPDPTTTAYAVCFYVLGAEEAFTLYFDAVAPAGLGCGRKRCWTRSSKGGVAYNGGPLRPDGVASLRIKPGEDGKAQLSFVGRGPNLDLTHPLEIAGGELLVELHAGESCWAAMYFTGGEPPDVRTDERYRVRGGE
ncbi:MAG: hypothetical protein AB1689_05815, partial [Thermodesulfobacteriota bacterium]